MHYSWNKYVWKPFMSRFQATRWWEGMSRLELIDLIDLIGSVPRDSTVLLMFGVKRNPYHPCKIWSDASFAPFRHTQRRSITGGILMFENSLVSALARQQQMRQFTCHRSIRKAADIARPIWFLFSFSLFSRDLNLHCRHCGCCGRATLQHNLSELSSCKSGLIARHRHRRRRRNPLRKAGTGTERHEPDQQLISARDVPRKSRHVESGWSSRKAAYICAELLTQCLGSQL